MEIIFLCFDSKCFCFPTSVVSIILCFFLPAVFNYACQQVDEDSSPQLLIDCCKLFDRVLMSWSRWFWSPEEHLIVRLRQL